MFSDFLSKLATLLFPITPESIRKKRLKELAKELSRNRMAKFYKPQKKEVTGEFGKFLYEIYRTVAAAQVYLKTASSSAVLKQLSVESFFDSYIQELNDLLSQDTDEWAKMGDIPAVVDLISEKQAAFSVLFDKEQEKDIDHCYNAILALSYFAAFGYFAFLKNFSAEIREQNFSHVPKFSNVPGAKVGEALKDFLEVATALGRYGDWERIINIVKLYRPDVNVIDGAQWAKVFEKIQSVLSSQVLELMIRHINDAPDWQFKPRLAGERVARKYLDSKAADVKEKINKLTAFQKDSRVDEMLVEIFDRVDVYRTHHYTASVGEVYAKKKFAGFAHADAINYFYAFLSDVFPAGIKDLCEMLMIRGTWLALRTRKEMSDCYHQIIEFAGKLAAFDSKFSELGQYGSRLKTSIASTDKNPHNARLVASILATGDKEAQALVQEGLGLIIGMDLILKSLLSDRLSPLHTVVGNWQEMDALGLPTADRLKTASVKIKQFAKLMFFLAGEEDFSRGYNAYVPDKLAGEIPHF
ncbi:MAG: DUF5312 family protein [Spirochaetes bacterium]|nr:DUF5312 family protein [Spirochaetota bacterium]